MAGNPQVRNLFEMVAYLQHAPGVRFEVPSARVALRAERRPSSGRNKTCWFRRLESLFERTRGPLKRSKHPSFPRMISGDESTITPTGVVHGSNPMDYAGRLNPLQAELFVGPTGTITGLRALLLFASLMATSPVCS